MAERTPADRDDPTFPTRIVFLCTGNACRSQMAEGWARALLPGIVEARSAGTAPTSVNPLALRAMAEVGIDLSSHTSKSIQGLNDPFDAIITLCDSAGAACPSLPGVPIALHRAFDDPPRLAASARSDEEAMPHYRRIRDEIRLFVQSLPAQLRIHTPTPHIPLARTTTMTMPTPTGSKADCFAPSCCCSAPAAAASPAPSAAPIDNPDAVRAAVRAGYGEIARSGSWSAAQQKSNAAPAPSSCCGGSGVSASAQSNAPSASAKSGCCGGNAPTASTGGCCGPSTFTPQQLAAAIGYTAGELASAPDASNMGLSCGNPTALASLRPGETVLDLGAGGGFDCFIAGPKVGAFGRVIGVDMTPEMLAKARANLPGYTAQTGLNNVEFRLGEIENIPAADASVDVIISNCVLNLSPDQPQVWREIARVLRPGGRVAVSDLVLLRTLPAAIRADAEALIGCIAGASLMGIVEHHAREAGLTDIRMERKPGYIDAMTDWQDPLYRAMVARLPAHETLGEYITSANITARKP